MALLIALFLATRLINLSTFPLHGDESTYVYWGKIVANDWSYRFIGDWGGKQPLIPWLVAVAWNILPNSPLVGARLISVIASAFTCVGLWLFARGVFSRRIAFLSVLMYLLIPYSTLFDRLILLDALTTAQALWAYYLCYRLFRRPTYWAGLGLALVIATGLLTKATSWMFLPLAPLAIVCFSRAEWRDRIRGALPKLVFGAMLGLVVYYVAYGSTPSASAIAGDRSYSLTFAEIFTFPFDTWTSNAGRIFDYFASYLAWPALIAAVVTLILSPRLGARHVALAVWTLLPVIAFIVIARVLFSRYFTFVLPPVCLLIVATLEWLVNRLAPRVQSSLPRWPLRALPEIATAIVLIIPIIHTGLLVLSPQPFIFASEDRDPYYLGALVAPAPLVADLRAKAASEPVLLLTNYGMDGVLMGVVSRLPRTDSSISVAGLWPSDNNKLIPYDPLIVPPKTALPPDTLQRHTLLFASVAGQEGAMMPFIKLIKSYPDLSGRDQYVLYSVDRDQFTQWLIQ